MNLPSVELLDWHATDIATLENTLDSSSAGLSGSEAAARLETYGPNHLPEKRPPAWWTIVLRQFQSPLIYVLALAAIVSLLIKEPTDAAFIAAVLCLNAVIGAYQEWRAEQSAQALKKLLQIRASVQRDGEVSEISAEAVVPGDIVWLESGNRTPADMRLLTANSLHVDESLLTGESLPVLKDPMWHGKASAPLGDRKNSVFAGSIVTHGRAKGIVVATGLNTSVGQLARDVLESAAGKPPLLQRMERFTRVVAVAVCLFTSVIAVLAVLSGIYSLSETFLFAVALAVSAIPEGLPVAMTVALAIATTRMARRGVIVRRLTAVEGLGSCTLVATDKTGTLTCNELTVREIRPASGERLDVTGEGFAPSGAVLLDEKSIEPGSHPTLEALARTAVLCNEADLHHTNGSWVWRGDTVDIALLSMAHKLGWSREPVLDLHPQINQIPFEPIHQFAASYNVVDGGVTVFVKGAPERVLAMCENGQEPSAIETAETMAARGLRVLALASGSIQESLAADQIPPEPSRLTFLGFVGMIDPLRPGVRDAVRTCHEAGVTVSMVTGDHPITALAIARELGLAAEVQQVVTGAELTEQSPDQLREMAQQARVFARVGPHQKLQIVKAAQDAGHFVAVTGDGVNDAPALRAANIGVAMGNTGTDVAREAAELVISDDNFFTIVAGIEEGRIAYDNVRKVIYLLVSTGLAELVLVGLSVLAGLPLPLLPVQILWLNLVTNGIQDVALAFEPGEEGVLRRNPKSPKERIFNQLMIERTVLGALVMGGVGFAAFSWMLQAGWTESEARNALLLLMVLFENVHIGNCRSETKSALALSPFRSPILLGGAILAFSIHVMAMYLPLGQIVLGTQPLGLGAWALLMSLALTIFPAMECHKWSWAIRGFNASR